MKTKTILKWLPVVLSVLGALGYSSRDTEIIRSGVQFASALTGSSHLGMEAFGALLSETVKSGSSENNAHQSRPHTQKRNSTTPHTYRGKISKIHDGDTLHVIDEDGAKHKIRMAYIDAPEINQAYGTRSRDNLIDAADGKKVKVRVFETDRYQREVAHDRFEPHATPRRSGMALRQLRQKTTKQNRLHRLRRCPKTGETKTQRFVER